MEPHKHAFWKKRVIINEIEYCPRAGKLDYVGHYLSEDKEVIQQKIRAGIFCEEDEKIMDNYCASHPGTSPDKLLLIRNIEELEKDGKTLVNETNIVPLNVRDIANCGNIIGRELQWFIYRHRKCFPFKEDIFQKIFTQEALEYESLKPFKEAIIAALSTNKRVQSPAERYLLVGDSRPRNYDESSGPKMDAKKGK